LLSLLSPLVPLVPLEVVAVEEVVVDEDESIKYSAVVSCLATKVS
jgi:hypothetical protein